MPKLKEVDLTAVTAKIITQLGRGGAFLTVADDDRVNTMTVGWATLGRMWGKPVCVVPVRCSRYTRQLIQRAASFSLSVPLAGALETELDYCGSKSGREVDKFSQCGLKLRPGIAINSPAIAGCDIVLECRILHRQTLEPLNLAPEINTKWYADDDYHILFYGEVIKTYAQPQ